MNFPRLLVVVLSLLLVKAVPIIDLELCKLDADCFHGFPFSENTLVCSPGSVCVARNTHVCSKPNDCHDALTTCVAGRCSYGSQGVPCSNRDDCGVGLFCSDLGKCTRGMVGSKCNVKTGIECSDGLACAVVGACMPGTRNMPCVLDRNCASGLYCTRGRCRYGKKRAQPIFFSLQTPTPRGIIEPSQSFTESSFEEMLLDPSLHPSPELSNEPSVLSIVEPANELTDFELLDPSAASQNMISTAFSTKDPEVSSTPEVTIEVVDDLPVATGTHRDMKLTSIPYPARHIFDHRKVVDVPEPSVLPTLVTMEQSYEPSMEHPFKLTNYKTYGISTFQVNEPEELVEPLTLSAIPTAIPIPTHSVPHSENSILEIVIFM